MNMKKLMASVVAATVLVSNVAFAAVSTTTTYNTDGTVDVKTNVSGISTPNAMVTYVLYGEKTRDTMPFYDETGDVINTTQTTPTEANIIYIDQDNNVTGSTVFVAPGLTVGQAYGAKVIVGTDSSADVSVPENEYTGDMYTLRLTDTDDYTATVEVRMGGDYVASYDLTVALASVKVPVGADCKVTFEATDAIHEIATSTVGTVTENDNSIDLNPEYYELDTEYMLSATTREKVVPPMIIVSSPITGIPNQVSYIVDVEHFDATKTGLKVEIIDWNNDNKVLHTFDDLVPMSEDKDRYAIRILDGTEGSQLNLPDVTNGYKVTPFIKGDSGKVYLGETSEGDSNYFTAKLDQDSTYESDSTQPSTSSVGVEDEEPADETVVGEEPAS